MKKLLILSFILATALAKAQITVQKNGTVPAAASADINAGTNTTEAITPASLAGSNYTTQTTNDGRYLQKSNNLSDLTNAATALTNLGVSSTSQGVLTSSTAPVFQTQSGAENAAVAFGTNTYAANLTPAITSYSSTLPVYVVFSSSNTGASTLSLNGLTAQNIYKDGSSPLVGGEIVAGRVYELVYDGTNFQLLGNHPVLTNGSVVYWNNGFSQDNSNFYYDGANHFLGLGTTSPASPLHLSDASTASVRGLVMDNSSASTSSAKYYTRKSRSGGVITTGDVLGNWTAAGHDGTQYTDAASIQMLSTGTVSTGIVPGQISFRTANTSGTLSQALLIDKDQSATFNGTIIGDNIQSRTTALTVNPVAISTGTNTVGNNLIFGAGLGTGGVAGTATSSQTIFQTPAFGSTSTTAQTYADHLILASQDITLGSTRNYGIWLGTPRANAVFSNQNYLVRYNSQSASTLLNAASGATIGLSYNGNSQLACGSGGITVTTTMNFQGSGQIISNNAIRCGNYSSVTFGSNIAIAPIAASTSNTAGGNVSIIAGQGTGTATPSQVLFQAPNTTTSGTTVQTVSTIASMDAVNGNKFFAINSSQPVGTARGFGAGGSYTQTADLWRWTKYDGTTETTLARVDKSGNIITTGYINGAMVNPRRSVTAATTITSSDGIVEGDATSGAFSITLLDATTVQPGAEFTIVKNDASANAITVATTSTQTINYPGASATTFTLSGQWNLVTVYSNGSNWIVSYKL